MRLNLKQLEAFVWVADLQSFRKAAQRLNTTQPNISARIAALEAALGVTLMTRDAGNVRLTARGQTLLDHARRVLQATDAMATAANTANQIDDTLRLGVTEMVAQTWLHPYLRALRDKYPRLAVELTVDFSVQLDKGLSERSLDLALQNAPFSRPVSGEVAIGQFPLIWVAAPELSSQITAAPWQSGLPVLTHQRDSWLYNEILAHVSDDATASPRLVPSTSLAACRQMVIDAMGVAALPTAMVSADIAQGRLQELRSDWTPAPLDFFARYEAERTPLLVADAAKIAVAVANSWAPVDKNS